MPNLPRLLLIFDHRDQSHVTAKDTLCQHLAHSCEITVATQKGQDQENYNMHGMIYKSSLAYYENLLLADMIFVFGDAAKLTRYSQRQHVWSFTHFDQFTLSGSVLSAPFTSQDHDREYTARQRIRNIVYCAPKDEISEIFGLTNAFQTSGSMTDAVTRNIQDITDIVTNIVTPKRTILIFAKYQSTGRSIRQHFSEFLASEISSKNTQVIIISKNKSSFYEEIPHTAFISFGIYAKYFRDIDYGPNVTVVFDDKSHLAELKLIKHTFQYFDCINMNILDAQHPVDGATFEAVCQDPGAFYRARLMESDLQDKVAQKSVSLIIPHYNTALWKLVRCLESALACKADHSKTQILLIDDGSTDDVQEDLRAHFGPRWGDITYDRKENTGLGPTRNYGVEKSDADFVYFLDSDDEIVPENLRPMIAESFLTDSDVVIGKRVLCTAEGSFISDSLDYIFEGIHRTATAQNSIVFDDIMANNKLIRRKTFIDKGLWFNPGLYEDNAFTVKLYNSVPRFSFLNVNIHRWYQYRPGESITKTVTEDSVRWKIQSLVDSWIYLSTPQRKRRLSGNISNDLAHYMKLSTQLEPDERGRLVTMARDYVVPRAKALNLPWQDFEFILQKVEQGVNPDSSDAVVGTADSYVFYVRSHFHLLSAILHTLHFRCDAVLILQSGSTSFSPKMIWEVRRSRLFSQVRVCGPNAISETFFKHIRLGSEAPLPIFDTLYRSFAETLGDLNPEATGVIFHDHLPEVYFMGRHFRQLIKYEDGYQSTNREMVLRTDDGVWGRVSRVCKLHYDKAHPTPRRISKLISSHPVDRELLTQEYAAAETVIQDFKVLAREHRTEMLPLLRRLYGKIKPLEYDSTIIFTQPLYNNFCSVQEHLAVVAHMVDMANTKHVYIKPHPSDYCDYSALGLPVVGTKVPFEYFEALDQKIKCAITFGSSALVGSTVVEDVQYLFPLEGFTNDDVRAALNDICYAQNALTSPRAQSLIAANPNIPVAPGRAAWFRNSRYKHHAVNLAKRYIGVNRLKYIRSFLMRRGLW